MRRAVPPVLHLGRAWWPARRFWRPALAVAGCLGWLSIGAAAGAQAPAQPPAQSPYPIFTADTFAATMKTIGQNFNGLSQAVSAGDFAEAKSRAIRGREQLATTVTYWRRARKDDAIKLLQSATARLDDLDTVLSRSPVDKAAVEGAVRQVGTACQACHSAYREQDPATKAFRIKSN